MYNEFPGRRLIGPDPDVQAKLDLYNKNRAFKRKKDAETKKTCYKCQTKNERTAVYCVNCNANLDAKKTCKKCET